MRVQNRSYNKMHINKLKFFRNAKQVHSKHDMTLQKRIFTALNHFATNQKYKNDCLIFDTDDLFKDLMLVFKMANKCAYIGRS